MTERCERCDDDPATRCCDAHEKMLCHWCYRYTHFVDVCECDDCKQESKDYEEYRRSRHEDYLASASADGVDVQVAAWTWAADPMAFADEETTDE